MNIPEVKIVQTTLECKNCGFVIEASSTDQSHCSSCGEEWSANQNIKITLKDLDLFAVLYGGQDAK